jgi:hypothetical protein
MSAREIIVYASDKHGKDVEAIDHILHQYHIPHRELSIDRDPAALGRVLLWTGRRSVPTLVAADTGSDGPYQPPRPVKSWDGGRGVDRGSIISEPSETQLVSWLRRQGFVPLSDI